MRPRHVLTGPQNLMFDVDAAEEAKHVALYRYELTGELYDDDEILDFFYNDITELEQEQRDEITFKSWLEEMISWGRFYEEETKTRNDPPLQPLCLVRPTTLHEMPPQSSDWAARQPHAQGCLG